MNDLPKSMTESELRQEYWKLIDVPTPRPIEVERRLCEVEDLMRQRGLISYHTIGGMK